METSFFRPRHFLVLLLLSVLHFQSPLVFLSPSKSDPFFVDIVFQSAKHYSFIPSLLWEAIHVASFLILDSWTSCIVTICLCRCCAYAYSCYFRYCVMLFTHIPMIFDFHYHDRDSSFSFSKASISEKLWTVLLCSSSSQWWSHTESLIKYFSYHSESHVHSHFQIKLHYFLSDRGLNFLKSYKKVVHSECPEWRRTRLLLQ